MPLTPETTIVQPGQERQSFLPFAFPDFDDTELEQIKDVMASGWITTGTVTRRFEKELAGYVVSPHAVAVNSCTAAMHLALEAIGLKQDDLVLTTPYTFAATAEVIRYFGAIPVFVDVDPVTLNIDATKLAETADALASQSSSARSFLPRSLSSPGQWPGTLKAIMPVHMAGYPCDLEAIYGVAQRRGLAVIEDAAHAFGSTYKNWPIGCSRHGSVPSAVCFSFYATKCLTTGEGGMICTSDEALADRCRMMSLHGISKDAWKRYSAEGSWYYEILAPGFKYNMTDVAAAMGLAQLHKAERMRIRRREIACRYNEAFASFPEIQVPYDSASSQHAWHLYMMRLNLERLALDRAQFMDELKNRGIGASVHFIPLHLHPYYREKYGYQAEDFPVAFAEYQREVSLPIYSKMTDADVRRVVDAVIDILAK
jgi:dTDP-4-amino-4,6-dideoxygalactose transaminase